MTGKTRLRSLSWEHHQRKKMRVMRVAVAVRMMSGWSSRVVTKSQMVTVVVRMMMMMKIVMRALKKCL